jgi:hypothetical protein
VTESETFLEKTLSPDISTRLQCSIKIVLVFKGKISFDKKWDRPWSSMTPMVWFIFFIYWRFKRKGETSINTLLCQQNLHCVLN